MLDFIILGQIFGEQLKMYLILLRGIVNFQRKVSELIRLLCLFALEVNHIVVMLHVSS